MILVVRALSSSCRSADSRLVANYDGKLNDCDKTEVTNKEIKLRRSNR